MNTASVNPLMVKLVLGILITPSASLQSIATGIEFGVFGPCKLLVQKNLYHLDFPKDDS